MNATPLENVLAAIGDYKKAGAGYTARCPAHEDRRPSLSINKGKDDTVLLKCHAGCSTEAVVKALGLTMRDLFPRVAETPRKPRKTGVSATATRKDTAKFDRFPTAAAAVANCEKRLGPRSAWWTYHDAGGEPVAIVVRWDKAKGKEFRPFAKTGAEWRIGDPDGPWPLYQLPALLQSQGRVYVCEGEKKTDAVRSLGLTATTSAHGANSAKESDWTSVAGRQVVILPDHDEPGGNYTQDVISLLAKVAPRPTIKVVHLPGLPAGGDAVQYIAARRAAGLSDAAIRAEIDEMADKAEPVAHQPPERSIAAYLSFPVHLLPEPIRGYVTASAAAIGCDPVFIGLPMLAALASAIGNSRRIALKRRWTEPAILWTLTVATSGGHKSPGFDAATLPVRKRQAKAKRRFDEAIKAHEIQMEEHTCKLADWKQAGADGPRPEPPAKPTWERCWTDDTTIEALASLLLQNPRGLLLPCDELSAWFASFDRYTKAGAKNSPDAARWLHIHGGRELFSDRKTGEPRTIFVPHATVSVAGGIQPGVLCRALSREHQENGMAARFLFAMPPKRRKCWSEAEIDEQLEADVLALFDRLFDLRPDHDEEGETHPRVLKLSTAAKHDVWIPFYNLHGKEQVELDDELSATWSKLEGYAARLALVHYLIRVAAYHPAASDPDVVDATSMAAGIALSRWFGQEAKRVYGLLAEGQTDEDCRKLVERIECLGGTITAYELKRHARQYRSTDQAEAALQDLADQGFGAWTAVSTAVHGGRPTRTFVLHRVAETPSKHEENGGFRYSNSNTQREQDDDWGGRMTPFSPSATAVLADLQALGIDVKPDGDAIRYRPRQAMTPALLRRLQTHKVELLAMLMIQQVHDLAELMAEAWQERLAICTADGIPLAEAEQTAINSCKRCFSKSANILQPRTRLRSH